MITIQVHYVHTYNLSRVFSTRDTQDVQNSRKISQTMTELRQACDGVWDVKTNQEVVDFVRARLKGQPAGAERVKKARR